MSILDELLDKIQGLPEEQRNAIVNEAKTVTQKWVPNPGPQYDAYTSEADEIFYGGSAGGGKSDMALGLAINEHERSLILREYLDDARDLSDRLIAILGSRQGWNGQLMQYREGSKLVRFGGCRNDAEKQRYKGKPYDLICFDEVSDFLESVYRFITTWNRSATGKRCRILACGNPPTKPEGLWVIRRWAAWLDPRHPNPAEPGELRWYITGEGDKDIEVDGPGEYDIGDEVVIAKSRTFIRAWLSDNPDLKDTGYDAQLSGLPENLRNAYRHGRFDKSIEEDAKQAIPTAWVLAAIDRRKQRPDVPQCAIGVDATGGSKDPMILAPRYDGWFDDLIEIPGKEIPMEKAGATAAGFVFAHRRDDSTIVVDMGGGYGGPLFEHLDANNIKAYAYKGSEGTTYRCKITKAGFPNVRSAAIWMFRMALDPGQPGGSCICLPDDPKLISDLTAATFEWVRGEIKVEPKEKVCDRLGRSTDRGDGVIMSWWVGDKLINSALKWADQKAPPKVITGRTPLTARRHR